MELNFEEEVEKETIEVKEKKDLLVRLPSSEVQQFMLRLQDEIIYELNLKKELNDLSEKTKDLQKNHDAIKKKETSFRSSSKIKDIVDLRIAENKTFEVEHNQLREESKAIMKLFSAHLEEVQKKINEARASRQKVFWGNDSSSGRITFSENYWKTIKDQYPDMQETDRKHHQEAIELLDSMIFEIAEKLITYYEKAYVVYEKTKNIYDHYHNPNKLKKNRKRKSSDYDSKKEVDEDEDTDSDTDK